MQVSTPASRTSAMARRRCAFEGHEGSKVRRTSSSSVVTVMLTRTRPPFSSILRKRSQSRTTSGLRVCTTSFGWWRSASTCSSRRVSWSLRSTGWYGSVTLLM